MDKFDEALWYAAEVRNAGEQVTAVAVARARHQATNGAPDADLTEEAATLAGLLDELVEYEGLFEKMSSWGGDEAEQLANAVYLFTERGDEHLQKLRAENGSSPA